MFVITNEPETSRRSCYDIIRGDRVECINDDVPNANGSLRNGTIYTVDCVGVNFIDLKELGGGWCKTRFRIVT